MYIEFLSRSLHLETTMNRYCAAAVYADANETIICTPGPGPKTQDVT